MTQKSFFISLGFYLPLIILSWITSEITPAGTQDDQIDKNTKDYHFVAHKICREMMEFFFFEKG